MKSSCRYATTEASTIREQRGMTKAQAAALARLDPRTVTRLENGQAYPANVLRRYAAALGVRAAVLRPREAASPLLAYQRYVGVQQLVLTSPRPAYFCTPELLVEDCSPALAKLLGLPVRDVIGMHLLQQMLPHFLTFVLPEGRAKFERSQTDLMSRALAGEAVDPDDQVVIDLPGSGHGRYAGRYAVILIGQHVYDPGHIGTFIQWMPIRMPPPKAVAAGIRPGDPPTPPATHPDENRAPAGPPVGRVVLTAEAGRVVARPADDTPASGDLAARCRRLVPVATPAHARLVVALSEVTDAGLRLVAACGPDADDRDLTAVLDRFCEAGGDPAPPAPDETDAGLRGGPGMWDDREVPTEHPTRTPQPLPGPTHADLLDAARLPPADRLAAVTATLDGLLAEFARQRAENADRLKPLLDAIPGLVGEGGGEAANTALLNKLTETAAQAGCVLIVKGQVARLRYCLGVFQARSAGRPQAHIASGKSLFAVTAVPDIPNPSA